MRKQAPLSTVKRPTTASPTSPSPQPSGGLQGRMMYRSRSSVVLALVCSSFLASAATGQEEPEKIFIGPNVNMVSGTEFPGGDPFLQRQNEPTGAVSSRNDLHLLAGANDYRAVDIPFEVTGPAAAESGGDSWLGVFTSIDGGSRWRSTLLPGYPQDPSCSLEAPPETRPPLCGYEAGADAVVRAGTHGLFYYSGIVFDRGDGAPSAVIVARFMDLNNDEGGEPIRHIDSVIAASNPGTEFLDKPWIAVDVPRGGASTVMFDVPQGEDTVSQTVSCGRVYLAYAEISGSPSGGDLRSKILFRSSADCGTSWSAPVQLSADDTLNQGASVAVSPRTGDVFVAWRRFSSAQSFLGEGLACSQPAGFWKTAEWPAATLTLGGVVYTKQQALNLLNGNPRGDATRILVHQLIPAKLNALAGTDDGLQNLIDLADAWLVANPIGSDPQGASREEGLSIKNGLQTFNDGGDPVLCGSTTPTTVLLDDAILVAKSTDGGQTFSGPAVVSIATPFDQGSTEFSFRSTAYPSIAVDAAPSPRTYVVWSQRGLALPSSDPEGDESRIAISTSLDGNTWTEPVPVDLPDAPGHQIKPSILFTGGKLVLAYYDFRQDVSNIFEQFVADWPLADRLRHTVDVRVAIADAGASPEFTDYSLLETSMEPRKPSQQASRYPFVIVGTSETDAETIQLQYMTPNVPLFAGGTRPFIGDFIDVLGQFFVRDPDGTWRFAIDPGDGGVYHAVWADNRDVVPPNDGDWTSYVPPLLAGQEGARPSVFDPAFTVPNCNDVAAGEERTGMRNQNIYTAVMTRGLLVAAPGNTKLLGPADGELVQATFVVFVQNVTDQDRYFRLTAGQPADGDASFDQLMLQTTIDITVPAYSSASRTVYLRSPDPTATALVLVTEIDFGGNPILGGLTGSVRLNPDPTSPPPDLSTGEIHTPAILNPAIFNPAILNPAIFNPAILNPAILNAAIFNPAIFNPAILNPAIFNPAIFNPAILNPAIFNPAIFNPAILNPAILNPAILNPAILNPAIFNPAILNPAILNPAILNTALDETSQAVDYTFAVRNEGTTTTAYDVNFNVGAQPEGLIYQLFVFRLNVTPRAEGCQIVEEAQQELLVNLLLPEVQASRLLDPADADPETATFTIEPGGEVYVTLRVLPDLEPPPDAPGDPLDFNEDNVSVAVVSQALDTADLAFGDTQPAFDVIVAPSTPVESLAFVTQPTTATGGQTIPAVEVQARDHDGLPLPGVIVEMTIGTAACASGALAGGAVALTDAAGVATFSAMSIDRGGYGYELRATAVGFPSVTTLSTAFDVEGFCETDNLAFARGQNPAILLPNGKVLLAGGTVAIGDVTASAELFDPAGNAGAGSFISTGSLSVARTGHGATLLPGGKVLLVGGNDGGGAGHNLSSAELFDPAGSGGVGSFTSTGDTAVPRAGLTVTLLPDGTVLIVGGTLASASAELFDPAGNAGAGSFSLTGSMSTPRAQHRAVLLPNGKVLVSGGVGIGGVLAGALASAELYDPTTGTFSPSGSMSIGRMDHSPILLPDGRVLISGGRGLTGGLLLATAELYDPVTGTFSPTGTMGAARAHHSSELLPNGKVLISGGSKSGGFLASAELYDPVTGTFSPTGSMSTARRDAPSTRLPDGRVLIAGGVGDNPPSFIWSAAEIFYPVDPPFTVSGFESTGSMSVDRSAHTATLLPDGRTLVAGGSLSPFGTRTASTELYDSASGSFVPTGTMGTPRSHHTATLLPNGEVLIAGGITNGLFVSPSVNTAETYDPVSGSFSPTGVMSVERGGHTATLLPNGKVLIVGGSGGPGSTMSAELYDPATRTFIPTGGMVQPRGEHTATLLPNGKVLIAGGFTDAAEVYDPDTGTFSLTGTMVQSRYRHTATMLFNGKVLVTGGRDTGTSVDLASAEVYDPALGTFSAVADMNSSRVGPTSTALPNGKVLISGGNSGGILALSSELYDPATATFSLTGSLIRWRVGHRAMMLPNGKVLVVGGGPGTVTGESAELYRPGH